MARLGTVFRPCRVHAGVALLGAAQRRALPARHRRRDLQGRRPEGHRRRHRGRLARPAPADRTRRRAHPRPRRARGAGAARRDQRRVLALPAVPRLAHEVFYDRGAAPCRTPRRAGRHLRRRRAPYRGKGRRPPRRLGARPERDRHPRRRDRMDGRVARRAAAGAFSAQRPPAQRRRPPRHRFVRAPPCGAGLRPRGARAPRRPQRSDALGVERARVRRTGLHGPRRLAALGRLPGGRAPGSGRAAPVDDAGRRAPDARHGRRFPQQCGGPAGARPAGARGAQRARPRAGPRNAARLRVWRAQPRPGDAARPGDARHQLSRAGRGQGAAPRGRHAGRGLETR